MAAFLSSLSWPNEVSDLTDRRSGRPISVSAALSCPDFDFWKLCWHPGNMLRALGISQCYLGHTGFGRVDGEADLLLLLLPGTRGTGPSPLVPLLSSLHF